MSVLSDCDSRERSVLSKVFCMCDADGLHAVELLHTSAFTPRLLLLACETPRHVHLRAAQPHARARGSGASSRQHLSADASCGELHRGRIRCASRRADAVILHRVRAAARPPIERSLSVRSASATSTSRRPRARGSTRCAARTGSRSSRTASTGWRRGRSDGKNYFVSCTDDLTNPRRLIPSSLETHREVPWHQPEGPQKENL